jgi:hypothetical protein
MGLSIGGKQCLADSDPDIESSILREDIAATTSVETF